MSPTLAVYLGSTVVLSILPVVAWAYLATVGIRGWRAGEDPIAGWRLVAFAAVLVLVALALVNVGGLLEVLDETLFRAVRPVDRRRVRASATSACWPRSWWACPISTHDESIDGDVEVRVRLGPVGRQRRGEVAQEVEALVDLFDRRVRPGHQEARATRQRDARRAVPTARRADGPAQVFATRL